MTSQWRWRGRDHHGVWREGEIEAEDRLQAQQRLSAQGVALLQLHRLRRASYNPRARALTWLLRQLAALLRAGVPLAQALRYLARDTAHARLSALLLALCRHIENGEALSVALARYPHLFSSAFCLGVAAGELGGLLDLTLERLVRTREQQLRLRAQLLAALVYPATLLLLALGLLALMLLQVLPSFSLAFSGLGRELPPATRALIALSARARAEWGAWLAACALVVLPLRLCYRRLPRLRQWLEQALLCLPLFGALWRQAVLARWARTLGVLFAAGVPLCDCLTPAADAGNSLVYRQATRALEQSLRSGLSLREAMSAQPRFPVLLLQMTAVGEESGALDQLLERVADYYEQEVAQALQVLTSLLEPLALLLLGGVCGVLIWALYLPMIQLGGVMAQ
jgi:type IV pilus assembly protein PilC